MSTKKKPELPIIPFASRDAWEAWLEEHHTVSDGLWLKIAKYVAMLAEQGKPYP
jgi:hypothetical protein